MAEWELCATNFNHPDITTGQHNNGPAQVWVKIDGVWYATGSHHMHRVRKELERNGPERIMQGTWDEYRKDGAT